MELLSEAMKHAEMEIYNLVSKIADLIDDYESDDGGDDDHLVILRWSYDGPMMVLLWSYDRPMMALLWSYYGPFMVL